MFLHGQDEIEISEDETGALTLTQGQNVIFVSGQYVDVFMDMLKIELDKQDD